MAEIHPPNEKIHSFRDFLLHLLTITAGLLIALALDAGVERLHHRSLRIEADENLRQELRHNQKELSESRAAIGQEKSNLVAILKFLQARAASQPYDVRSINLNFTLATMSDASWRTASATGVISYMNYARVQKYANAYQVQEDFTRLQTNTFSESLRLQSYFVYGFDPEKMPPEEARAATVDVRQTVAYLQALDQVGNGLEKIYETALADN